MTPLPHNPDNLPPETVGVDDGWRLLDEDEVGNVDWDQVHVDKWSEFGWQTRNFGWDKLRTYRTRLSRTELRAARGLEPISTTNQKEGEPCAITEHQPAIQSTADAANATVASNAASGVFNPPIDAATPTPETDAIRYNRDINVTEIRFQLERLSESLERRCAELTRDRDQANREPLFSQRLVPILTAERDKADPMADERKAEIRAQIAEHRALVASDPELASLRDDVVPLEDAADLLAEIDRLRFEGCGVNEQP